MAHLARRGVARQEHQAGHEPAEHVAPHEQAQPLPVLDRGVLPEHELAARLRELLAPFAARVREIRPAVSGADAVVRRPVLTGCLKGPWNRGNGVVIGDAAHAPAPQMASGAALAVEDGLLLAEELERHESTAAGLEAFVRRRAERCRTLVDTSVALVGLERAGRLHDAYPLIEACHRLMAEPA